MLEWQTTHHSQQQIFRGRCDAGDYSGLQQAFDQCAEKATQLLPEQIQDSSRYLLFSWQDTTLTIVLTDDTRQRDGNFAVVCEFPNLHTALAGENTDEILAYWATDYLASCSAFLQYSLLAAFTRSGRDRLQLL